MHTTKGRERITGSSARLAAAVASSMLAACAGAPHTTHSAAPPVNEERPAAAPADTTDARAENTPSERSNVALTGRVLLPDGAAHTGAIFVDISYQPTPNSGYTTVVPGTCAANGEFAVTGRLPGVESGDRIDIRLRTAPMPDELEVSIVASDMLFAAASREARDGGEAKRFDIDLGDLALTLPVPIATITVNADSNRVHTLAIEPNFEGGVVMAREPAEIALQGQCATPVYSFEPWDEWTVACPVGQLVGRPQIFERGDEVTVELLTHLRVTGTADLATIPARSIVMIVDSENYRPPEECRLETLVDVCMRTIGRTGVWSRCESVREDGSIPPHDMVPGDYVIEVWPPIEYGDDLRLPAPAPLATLHVAFDVEHTTYALK
jgi:hypothetical protein